MSSSASQSDIYQIVQSTRLIYNSVMDQIILPTNIVKKVERLSKELKAVKKEVAKAIKVPKSQAWFWSKAWQIKEKTADRALKEGKLKTFSSVKELLNDLGS